MQPLDPDVESLLRQWIEKAEADLEVAQRIAADAADNLRIREIAGFHCQQAAEKYRARVDEFGVGLIPLRCGLRQNSHWRPNWA